MLQNSLNNTQKNSGSEKDHFQNLGTIIASYLNFGKQTSSSNQSSGSPNKHKNTNQLPGYIKVLKLVPAFLVIIFLFSFFWDFNSVETIIFGQVLNFEGLLRIISISGLIGFLTNWIAITMLFKPIYKRPILGQGLIPAHKERIAYRLASAVSDDIINTQLIKQKIDDSKAVEKFRIQAIRHVRNLSKNEGFRSDLKIWLLNYLDSIVQDEDFKKRISAYILSDLNKALKNNLVERFALQAYSFIKGRSVDDIIEDLISGLPVSAAKNLNLVDEYLDQFPEKFENRSIQIEEAVKQIIFQMVNQLDVQQLAEENLNKYDERRLEQMIKNATNEHLKVIQYLGAILGTIGGFVIWEPIISLTILSILAGLVFLADYQIYNLKRKG